VFGLDGAGFELIEPWLDAGELPNVKQAVETGISGDLRSVMPPVTSPNWKTYATGKNPGKIGIYWWENVDVEERRVYYPTERKSVNTEFWEIIGEEDSAGVIGVPTTYPPKSIDGFLVAGGPDGSNEGFARPPELEKRLREEFGYRVLKRNRLADDFDAAAAEIHDLIDIRFTVAKRLFEEWDVPFLQVTTFYLNSLHPFLWNHEYTLEG
jgi:predicted AlkP superfamily phosphohydrolase/phosphomutase